jgi:SAM-dependent methyltransferase
MGFNEQKWILRLAYLKDHGQRIEQHSHFYKDTKGAYDLSAENVNNRLSEDRAWLVAQGYSPTRFVSGGWRMNAVIRRALIAHGYADCTEDPRTTSPRKAFCAIAFFRAGPTPPLLYFHDYELLSPLIVFCARFVARYWRTSHFFIRIHPHDHKRARDWRMIIGFFRAFLANKDIRSVLELGAGTGNIAAYCVQSGIRAVAEDINAGYLAAIRKRDARIDIVRHDINDPLPYPDGFFDMSACIGTLHYGYVKDADAVMREIVRVSGKYVMIDFLSRYSLYRFFERIWNPHYSPQTYSAREAADFIARHGMRVSRVQGGRTPPFIGMLCPFSGKTAYFILEKKPCAVRPSL